jgi:membrane-bound lytic murein transglycosylase F
MYKNIAALLLLTACGAPPSEPASPVNAEPTALLELGVPVQTDLADIHKRGVLSVALTTDSTGYFLYRNQPMGFEFDVLTAFADSLDVSLDVHVIHGRQDRLTSVLRGTVDIAAGRLAADPELSNGLAFSEPLYAAQPVIVQADPSLPLFDDGAVLSDVESLAVQAHALYQPADLAGETVWLQNDSQWVAAVNAVEIEHGDIEIRAVESDVSTETLLRWVATGRIERTIASRRIAELGGQFYDNLVVSVPVGQQADIAFALRTPATELGAALDEWLLANSELVGQLHHRYFEDRDASLLHADDSPFDGPIARVSDYDDLFRAFAPQMGWDWRLLAAQAFQESTFNPTAQSWSGAQGLLQLMPATAREVGVDDAMDPSDNTRGAVAYLMWLEDQLINDIPDPDERVKFILASYNAGLGHVQDAQRLAVAHGDNPLAWDDVQVWMERLEDPEWFEHSSVEHGYCRGSEPVAYVSRILTRYEHYQQFVSA